MHSIELFFILNSWASFAMLCSAITIVAVLFILWQFGYDVQEKFPFGFILLLIITTFIHSLMYIIAFTHNEEPALSTAMVLVYGIVIAMTYGMKYAFVLFEKSENLRDNIKRKRNV